MILYYPLVLSAPSEKVSIQLKWKHSFQFAGYYAAIEQGYYRDAGLDVSLKEVEFSKDFVAQVLNNESEYGVSDNDLLIYHLKGKPVVLINQFFQHSPLVFLSRRESGIVKPKDMANKTLAYNLLKQGDTALKALLSKAVGDLSKIKQKAFGIQSYQDFIDGKIDVISAYSSSQPYLLRQQGVDVNIINPQSYGISFYGDNFFTTEMELEKHPERVEKMSLATKKGWQFALEHPDEIITLIRQKYAVQLSVDHLKYQARTLRQMILPELIDLGTADPKRYQRIAETYQQLGLTKSSKVMRHFFYQHFKHDSNYVQLSRKEALWLSNHPTIAAGAESDWPPFDFADDKGKNIGIARDYLDLIGKKTGLNFDVSINPWSESLKKLENKQLDLLVAAYYTDERATYALYSKPYFKILHYFFVRDDLKVKTIEDLNGKRIAVPKSYAIINIMKAHFPGIKILVVESTDKAIDAVLENRADMLFDSYAVLSYMLRHRGIRSIIPFKRPRSIIGGSSPLHIISRNDSPELASIIQKGLDAVTTSEKQEIYSRWMGTAKAKTKKTVHLTDAEQQWLKQNPVVKLSGGDNWPPFDFTNKKGELEGFSYDYIKLIEQKTGLQFEVNLISWTESLEKIREGTIDLMMGASFSEEREQYMTFSQPYFETLNYFFIRDDLNINSIKDLNGKRVAIPKGWSSDKTIKKYFPKLIIVPVASIPDGVEAMLENRVDILYDSYAVINYILKKEGINSIIPFKSSRSQTGTDPLHLISRKNAPHLASILQKGLDAITPEERIGIQNKWLDDRSINESNIELTETERQWLDEHKTIRFSGNPNWLPYEGIDKEGNYIGIVAEHLKLIEQRLGIETEFIPTQSWDESVAKVKQGEINVFSESIDSELKSHLTFTRPYLSSPVVVVMKNNEAYVENIEQIKSRKIALISTYGYAAEIIGHYPDIKFERVKNIQDGLTAVSTSKVDAFFAPLAQASYQISELGMNDIRIVGKTEFTSQFAFAMSAEFDRLVPLFNRALLSISPREKQRITHLWGKQKFASKIDYVLLVQSISILLIVILGIIYWNWKLAGHIRLRKKAEIALAKSQEKILRFSEEKFFKVFQSSPEIFIIIRIADENILEVNNTFEQLSGWDHEEAVGKTALELDFWSVEESIAVIGEIKDKGLIRNKDTTFRTKAGDNRIGRTSAEMITIGGESCFIVIVDDVTDRRRTQAALRQSENKFSTAFLSSPFPLLISSLPDGTILEVNNAFISLFEYTRDELIGFSDLDLPFWTDLQVRKVMIEQLNELKQVKEMEAVVQTKSGGLLYCVFSAEVIILGGIECIINIIQDISQRKQAENEVLDSRERMRNLANRLEEIREIERIGIARELHDELGQALTGFKIDLVRLSENIPKLKTNQDLVKTMVNNIDSTIDVIRKISSDLRPPILDDLGLEAAIEWATRRFSEQTGIKHSIDLDCDEMEIDRARDTAVFRIYQEALVNIARHSHAKKIEANVQIVDSVLELVIKDDGVGISDAQIHDNKSIGLIGMQERAAHIGASISIKNAKSGGTEVSLSVPLVLETNN